MRGERGRARITLSLEQALRDVEPSVPDAAWATNPTQTRVYLFLISLPSGWPTPQAKARLGRASSHGATFGFRIRCSPWGYDPTVAC